MTKTSVCSILAVIFSLVCAVAVQAQPLPVIVETDMGNDIDDAIALDLLFKAADDGLVEILAISNHKKSATASDYIDIMNTWYGYPSIPIGKSPTPVENNHAPDYTLAVTQMTGADGAPAFARSKRADQYENPVSLYRRLLAVRPDNSVAVISLGFGTELAKLLESPADEYSPLTGRELVARKVKVLSVMAGSYGDKKRAEYNVVNDIPAMQKVFEQWPTPIVQNPFEIGPKVQYPGSVIAGEFGWAELHPMVEGYKNYRQMPYNRATWDLLSVIYLLHPEMFTRSASGVVSVDDNGFTDFRETDAGQHIVLSATPEQCRALKAYIIEQTKRKPRHYGIRR